MIFIFIFIVGNVNWRLEWFEGELKKTMENGEAVRGEGGKENTHRCLSISRFRTNKNVKNVRINMRNGVWRKNCEIEQMFELFKIWLNFFIVCMLPDISLYCTLAKKNRQNLHIFGEKFELEWELSIFCRHKHTTLDKKSTFSITFRSH